jgi:hypothetical protein
MLQAEVMTCRLHPEIRWQMLPWKLMNTCSTNEANKYAKNVELATYDAGGTSAMVKGIKAM